MKPLNTKKVDVKSTEIGCTVQFSLFGGFVLFLFCFFTLVFTSNTLFVYEDLIWSSPQQGLS